jgi:predicted  nucleic acid-binding Zn-ribbon protein
MLEKQHSIKSLQEQVLLLQQEVKALNDKLQVAHENYEKVTRDLADSVRSELDYRDAIKRLYQRIQSLENK